MDDLFELTIYGRRDGRSAILASHRPDTENDAQRLARDAETDPSVSSWELHRGTITARKMLAWRPAGSWHRP